MFTITQQLKLRTEIDRKFKKAYLSVFGIVCTKNKKIYITSSFNTDKKIREHLNSLKDGTHRNKKLQRDFTLYGRDKFKVRILQRFGSNDTAKMNINEKYSILSLTEEHYLKVFEAFNPKYGYNKRKKTSRSKFKQKVDLIEVKKRKKK